jgi:hypothetical protein
MLRPGTLVSLMSDVARVMAAPRPGMKYHHGRRAKSVPRRRPAVLASAWMSVKVCRSKLCDKEAMIELHLIDAGN